MTEISVAKTRLTGLIHRVEGGEIVHLTRGLGTVYLMRAAMKPSLTKCWMPRQFRPWRYLPGGGVSNPVPL
jgi:antitoxin (DNA-binding transcriptional repressor) of toxin-antitoxin stability system